MADLGWSQPGLVDIHFLWGLLIPFALQFHNSPCFALRSYFTWGEIYQLMQIDTDCLHCCAALENELSPFKCKHIALIFSQETMMT